MDSRLELADEARQVCSKALVKIGTGQVDAAVELLEAFGSKCWGIVQGAGMDREQADLREGTLDLAALRGMVDLRSEAPEHDED